MVVIKLSAFAGEKPLISPRLLPETAALSASNARLNDGALTPINQPTEIGIPVSVATKTIYRHGSEWLTWTIDVHAAPGPVAEDRLYYTGDGAPKMRVSGAVYPLALAAPTVVPVATLGGTGSGDTVSRAYVWTWVTAFGEESAPSPASNLVDWKPGNTVTLSGFPAVPAGRNINRQRIYRSQTGTSGTYLYLIAERAATNGNFIDNIAVDAFQEALPSSGWTSPPDNMSGLISMPNGMMAAISGRDVLFCEPWRPHAWPDRYTMTCDNEVVGLAALAGVLIVLTKGAPYIMSGSHPDSMQSLKLEANFACINARGIVNLGFAVCYPSSLGLVTVAADGTVKLATEQLFSRNDWLAFSPETIVAAEYAGSYLFSYDTANASGERTAGSMMVNVGAGEFIVRSSEIMSAAWFDEKSSTLFFTRSEGGQICQFDDPDAPPESYHWHSKEFWLTKPTNFGAILIDFGGADGVKAIIAIEEEYAAITVTNQTLINNNAWLGGINEAAINQFIFGGDALLPFPSYSNAIVNVYADRQLVRTVSPNGNVQRLPSKRTARLWEVSVAGNVQITQVIMATTIDELRRQL